MYEQDCPQLSGKYLSARNSYGLSDSESDFEERENIYSIPNAWFKLRKCNLRNIPGSIANAAQRGIYCRL